MKIFNLILILIVAILFFGGDEVHAAKKSKKKYKKQPVTVTPSKYAALVIDVDTGAILHEEKADLKRYPASLTKLMTLYLTFDALKKEEFALDDLVKVSKHASYQARMNLALKANQSISVQNLISSLVVVSANDSAVVLAEKIGQTEKNFAILMTEKAHELGMSSTTFKNASGLFDPNQVTTARDMATLMISIKRDFPEYYEMLSLLNFTYKGVTHRSHTTVMKVYPWAKAAKTGYVRASGFNLAIGAQKDKRNLVAVVMGGVTAKARDKIMIELLNKSFNAKAN